MSFHQFHDGWMSGIQEPEVFYLGPNIPLADEDDANRFESLEWLTIMVVDDPQNTQNQKKFF